MLFLAGELLKKGGGMYQVRCAASKCITGVAESMQPRRGQAR